MVVIKIIRKVLLTGFKEFPCRVSLAKKRVKV